MLNPAALPLGLPHFTPVNRCKILVSKPIYLQCNICYTCYIAYRKEESTY